MGIYGTFLVMGNAGFIELNRKSPDPLSKAYGNYGTFLVMDTAGFMSSTETKSLNKGPEVSESGSDIQWGVSQDCGFRVPVWERFRQFQGAGFRIGAYASVTP